MTDDYIQDGALFWDQPEEEMVDREVEQDGRRHFGFLRLHIIKVTKSWTAGDYITIPGVVGGNFNEKDESGLMKFKSWKKGGNRLLFVAVATKEDKDGNEYQIVKQYKHKLDRGDTVHIWGDFVFPALQKLPKTNQKKLSTTGMWASWSDVPVGEKFTSDDGEEHDVMAWSNFTIYENKEQMKEASDEFFDGIQEGQVAQLQNDWKKYPAGWELEKTPSNMADMIEYIKEQIAANVPVVEIAKETYFLDENGKLLKDGYGGEVDARGIFAEIIDAPPPMIANLLKGISKGDIPF